MLLSDPTTKKAASAKAETWVSTSAPGTFAIAQIPRKLEAVRSGLDRPARDYLQIGLMRPPPRGARRQSMRELKNRIASGAPAHAASSSPNYEH
jgi:hypothetical protein